MKVILKIRNKKPRLNKKNVKQLTGVSGPFSLAKIQSKFGTTSLPSPLKIQNNLNFPAQMSVL